MKDADVNIFACDHGGIRDFVQIENEPVKKRPICTTCGATAKHMGPATIRRMLERAGR